MLRNADAQGALDHTGAASQDVQSILHHAAAQQLVQSLDACPDVGRVALIDLGPVVQKSVHLLLGSKQLTLQALAAGRHSRVQLSKHLVLWGLVRQGRQPVLQRRFQLAPPGSPGHDLRVLRHVGSGGRDLHQLSQILPQRLLLRQALPQRLRTDRQAVDGLTVPVHGHDHPVQVLVEGHGEIRLPQDSRHPADASAVNQHGAKDRLLRLHAGKITHTRPPPGRQ